MASKPVSAAPFGQHAYVVATAGAQTTEYQSLCGSQYDGTDLDTPTSGPVLNTQGVRQLVLVQNTSGSTIEAGTALNWVTGYWGTQVQPCPAGQQVRGFAPAYVNGSLTGTIPNNAFFMMVKSGPTNAYSDGTAITANDGLVVGATSGQLRTDYGLGGGAVYASKAASTAVTATTTPTKFDQNYTFPANSLNAGDIIRVVGEAIATSTNSTDTLTLDLMIGATVVATTGAIDVANNDAFEFVSDITVRTNGASGTIVGATIINTATGDATFKEVPLASTAIDTTATQQVAIRATWSTNNAGNSCRQDVLNISRLNSTGVGLRAGTAMAAAAGGSSVSFRINANCQW